ncbi:DEAD-box ATP-dependent RNA helicase 16 [Dorcoceras hygrometricum]|uniref:DEAD-box ATP-dependent RNA helicase 16 n=1 Tax=Dorcoceras hygrometricum TaxID=472368 RepID=A0A2Z7AQ39_9LAMI|nr:DEAD-box ATP-dependent RNA helicase 16 [Dorcoceras hygrometricum]
MKKAAGALSVDVMSSDIKISRKIFQQRASTSRGNLELAIAKRCRLHKLIRQRFAFALKIQQMLFALISSSRKIPAGSYSISRRELQWSIFNQSRMHSKRCRLNKMIRHRLIYPVVGSPVASI